MNTINIAKRRQSLTFTKVGRPSEAKAYSAIFFSYTKKVTEIITDLISLHERIVVLDEIVSRSRN